MIEYLRNKLDTCIKDYQKQLHNIIDEISKFHESDGDDLADNPLAGKLYQQKYEVLKIIDEYARIGNDSKAASDFLQKYCEELIA